MINPATQERLSEVPRGTYEDIDWAVDATITAFPHWCRIPVIERAAILHEVATKIRNHQDELEWTHNTFDYYAELARHERGRVILPGDPTSQFNFILKELIGVIGCIVPWNYSLH